MDGMKLDTLEKIENVMSQMEAEFAGDDKSIAIGPKVVAPLAEALATLAREVRKLRDEQG